MRKITKLLFIFYQSFFSSPVATCRYRPTCSQYFLDATEKYGFFKGFCFTFLRILSCHPFSKRPIIDPA